MGEGTITTFIGGTSEVLCDMTPTEAILGRRITGVLLKRRRAGMTHPPCRLFLMFDDGAGFEFFTTGWLQAIQILTLSHYRSNSRMNLQDFGFENAYYCRLETASPPPRSEVRPHKPTACAGNGEESSSNRSLGDVIGRRISGLNHQVGGDVEGVREFLYLRFSDDSVFEIACTRGIHACRQLESFELSSLVRRGKNAYLNELLVLEDPDSGDRFTAINKPSAWV